jgi:opacity protein-like surface antigen
MPKSLYAVPIVAVLALLGSVPSLAADGDVSVLLGQKSASDDRLEVADVDAPLEFGVMLNLDFGWPVSLAFDLLRASDDATLDIPGAFPSTLETDVDTTEFHAGARYFFRKDKPFRMYAGAGAAFSQLDVKQVQNGSFGPGSEFSDTLLDDGGSGVGFWVDAGLLYRLNRFQVGADVRYSDASVEVTAAGGDEPLDLDSGGLHAAVFVGFAW